MQKKGHKVHAYDVNSELRELLRTGRFKSIEPGLDELLEDHKILIHDSIKEAVDKSRAIFVIVPTPSLPSGQFSNEFVLDAIADIGKSIGTN